MPQEILNQIPQTSFFDMMLFDPRHHNRRDDVYDLATNDEDLSDLDELEEMLRA